MERGRRVGPVEAAYVGRASFIGRLHSCPGLVDADALNCGALRQSEVGRAVETDVKAALVAEHNGGRPAQHDASTAGGQRQHVLFGGVADFVVVLKVRGWGQCRAGGHGVAKRAQQAVNWRGPRLLGGERFAPTRGRHQVCRPAGSAINERYAEPLGDRWGDDAASGAIGGRNSDEARPGCLSGPACRACCRSRGAALSAHAGAAVTSPAASAGLNFGAPEGNTAALTMAATMNMPSTTVNDTI